MIRGIRLVVFAVLSSALLAVVGMMRRGGAAAGDGEAWLVPLGVLSVAYAIVFVGDVVFHALKGEGQACRVCGHVRPVRSFRIAGPCPKCGG